MITIKRNSFWYALACFPNKQFYPIDEPHNLCHFFWLTVGKALVWLLVACFLGFIIGTYVAAWFADPALIAWRTFLVILTAAAGIGFLVLYIKFEESDKPNPMIQYFKAYKKKHCPMVYYVD